MFFELYFSNVLLIIDVFFFALNRMEISDIEIQVLEAYNNVEKWSKTERAAFSIHFFPMGPSIRKEAKGVVLIIG